MVHGRVDRAVLQKEKREVALISRRTEVELSAAWRKKPMKKLNLFEANDFADGVFKRLLVHDSPFMKVLNFNFKAGQELPVHSHDIEGEVTLTVIEGEGEFLGADGATLTAKPGDILVSQISEPHGLRARTDLRLLVTIAPPI